MFTKQELTVTIRTDRNDKEQESIILFPNGQDLEQSAPAQVAKTILVWKYIEPIGWMKENLENLKVIKESLHRTEG